MGGWFKEKDWIGWQEHMTALVNRLETLLKSQENHFELIPPKSNKMVNVTKMTVLTEGWTRMADKGEIERVQRGVYCHIKQTVFGKVTPSIDEIVIKTLKIQDEKRIGYESGAFLLNRLGISTLMPRDIEITTNRYGAKLPEGCRIVTCKPAVTVTDENWKLLQFIDLVSELPNAHIDAENPEQLFSGKFLFCHGGDGGGGTSHFKNI